MKPTTSQSTPHPNEQLQISRDGFSSPCPGIQFKRLRPGLIISIVQPKAGTPLTTHFEVNEAPLQFGFTYSGKNRCTYSSGSLRNQTHEMQSGSNGIFYLPKTKGVLEKPAIDPACVIAILASPIFLRGYFADSMDQLPSGFQKKIDEAHMEPLVWFGKNNHAKHHLLSQILNCPYTGGVRNLFLESRAMELLALQINDYSKAMTHNTKQTYLCPDDIERIQDAKKALIQDLDNPPSLSELAIYAGVNEKKLKMGFRRLFGTSVFGYFREHRLQKAHEILMQGNCNVTETAYTVGYQSLSHFSQAFKQRFGVLPKDFQKSQRSLLVP